MSMKGPEVYVQYCRVFYSVSNEDCKRAIANRNWQLVLINQVRKP